MADVAASNLGIDVGSAIADVTRFATKLDDLTASIANLGQGALQFNSKGKLMGVTMTQVIDTGSTLTSNFIRQKSAIKGGADTFVLYEQSVKRSKKALEDLNNIKLSAQQVTRESLTTALTSSRPNAANATPAETKRLNAEINKVVGNIGKGSVDGFVDAAKVQDIFARMTAGATNFTAAERIVVNQLKAATAAADQLGDAYLKAVAKGASSPLKKPATQAVPTAVLNQAGTNAQSVFANNLKFASPQQIIAFNTALQGALKLLSQGKVTAAEFDKALSNIKAGTITTQLNPALAQLDQKLLAVKAAFGDTGSTGRNAGAQIFLSWQNVVRIFESSLLYSAIGKLQAGFASSITEANAFSKQIGLIQTISQDAGVSSNEWASGLRRVSDELGLPVADVASAAYEALSNQVSKGADSFRFLGTSAQFARTTQSSLTDSVNLISSALNSFNLDASQSERVARSFFTLIDLGRVKTPELANSFGRIATQAANLGVSLEETNATISVLTRQGIKSNEAFTLVGNVFQKLLKPTEEMKKIFKSLGVESAEAGIAAAGGTVPFFLQISEAAKKAGFSISQLFDEIRGRRGFENLTADGGKALNADLDAQQNNTGQYDNSKKIVAETFGQKFDQELNKIKNFFVADVGGTFLAQVIKLSDAWGGLAKSIIRVLGVLKALAPLFVLGYAISQVFTTVRAFQTLGTAILEVRTLTAGLTATTLAYGAAAGAALAAATAGVSVLITAIAAYAVYNTEFGSDVEQQFRELTDKFQGEADKLLDIEQKGANDRAKAFETGLTNATTSFLTFAGTIRAGLSGLSDDIQSKGKDIGEALKAQFDIVGGTARSQIQEMEGELKQLTNAIAIAEKSKKTLPEDLEDKIFQRNLKVAKGNGQRGAQDDSINLALDYIRLLDNRRQTQILDTKNPHEVEKTLKKIDSAIIDISQVTSSTPLFEAQRSKLKQYYKEVIENGVKLKKIPNGVYQEPPHLKKIGKLIQDEGLQTAEALLLEQEIRIVDTIQKQIEAYEKRSEIVRSSIADAKKNFELLQEAQKAVLSFTPLDKKGEVKDEFRGPDGAAKAENALREKQQKVVDLLGAVNASVDTQVHTSLESAKQLVDLFDILNKQRSNVGEIVGTENALTEQTRAIGVLGTSKEALIQSQQKLNGLELENSRTLQEQIVKTRTLLTLLATRTSNNAGNLGFFNSFESEKVFSKVKKQIEKDAADLEKIFADPNFGNAQTLSDAGAKQAELQKHIQEANKLKGGDPGDRFQETELKPGELGRKGPTVISTAETVRLALERIAQSKSKAKEIADAYKVVEERLQTIGGAAAALDPAFKGLGGAAKIGGESAALGLSPVQEVLKTIREEAGNTGAALQRLLDLQKEFKTPSAPAPSIGADPTVEEHATGGRVGYYASGGFVNDFLSGKYAKGTDTIPVMATKGEYIVDAASTRKFLPLLQSISAGRLKSSSGVPSSTTTVGDINISVNGGSTASQTVREIGTSLRRGLRQGTVRLN